MTKNWNFFHALTFIIENNFSCLFAKGNEPSLWNFINVKHFHLQIVSFEIKEQDIGAKHL
jgi:hypothetical protein